MKHILTLFLLLITGCAAAPVSRDFPKAIEEVMQACPDLQRTSPDTTKLSEVLQVVVANYAQYHECRAKVDSWIKWYNEQKKIYESVK